MSLGRTGEGPERSWLLGSYSLNHPSPTSVHPLCSWCCVRTRKIRRGVKAQESVVSVGETGPSFQKQEAKKNQPHGTAYMDFPVLNARLTACLNSNNAILPLLLQMWKPKDKEERPQRVKVTQGRAKLAVGLNKLHPLHSLSQGPRKTTHLAWRG